MAMEPKQLELAVADLEIRVERLRHLYDQYFLGFEKLEPTIAKREVERKFELLRREHVRNTGVRFRLQVVTQRYNTFQTYWHRICRQIELGTYERHLSRAKKKFGMDAAGAARLPPMPELPSATELPPMPELPLAADKAAAVAAPEHERVPDTASSPTVVARVPVSPGVPHAASPRAPASAPGVPASNAKRIVIRKSPPGAPAEGGAPPPSATAAPMRPPMSSRVPLSEAPPPRSVPPPPPIVRKPAPSVSDLSPPSRPMRAPQASYVDVKVPEAPPFSSRGLAAALTADVQAAPSARAPAHPTADSAQTVPVGARPPGPPPIVRPRIAPVAASTGPSALAAPAPNGAPAAPRPPMPSAGAIGSEARMRAPMIRPIGQGAKDSEARLREGAKAPSLEEASRIARPQRGG